MGEVGQIKYLDGEFLGIIVIKKAYGVLVFYSGKKVFYSFFDLEELRVI